ncbi:MAG: hypothetical protein HYX53_13210 [Chloroflexi bacterium]|nr:hypothetical protein [Chloroflexota bacterium]
MGIGFSIFMVAVGAILAFAVDYRVVGIDIQAIGWILMIVGVLGAVLSLLFWSSFAAWWPGHWGGRSTYIESAPDIVYRESPRTIIERDAPTRYHDVERTVTREYGPPPDQPQGT